MQQWCTASGTRQDGDFCTTEQKLQQASEGARQPKVVQCKKQPLQVAAALSHHARTAAGCTCWAASAARSRYCFRIALPATKGVEEGKACQGRRWSQNLQCHMRFSPA